MAITGSYILPDSMSGWDRADTEGLGREGRKGPIPDLSDGSFAVPLRVKIGW
jgi:hypothetical protein